MLKYLVVPMGLLVVGALAPAAAVLEPVPGAAAQEERERAQAGERERREILEGLEQGMVALERLGRREELRMLRAVAEEVRAQMRAPERGEALGHEIEVFELALPALREAGREDTAKLVELAIARRRMAIEGARGPDAEEANRRAPNRPQEIEILRHAARLWEEFGHERKARAVAELAERLSAESREEPERARPGAREERRAERPEARREERREERRDAPREEQSRRLDHLERQLAEIEQAVQALHEELRSLRRAR